MSVDRRRLKNPLRLAFWLTDLLTQSGITVAIPRWNFTSFPHQLSCPSEGRPNESRHLTDVRLVVSTRAIGKKNGEKG